MAASNTGPVLSKEQRAAIQLFGSYKRFYDSLEQEDDLGLVLRGHMCIESLMQMMVEMRLEKPEELRWRNFRFDAKLDLCVALGAISPQYRKVFKDLDDLRNNFAHKPDYKLSEDDVDRLMKHFASQDRDMVLNSFGGPVPPLYKVRIAIFVIYLFAYAFTKRVIGNDTVDKTSDMLKQVLTETMEGNGSDT